MKTNFILSPPSLSAQSATESLKRLDDWEYEDSITLMFTAETDEGRMREEKEDTVYTYWAV